MKKRILFLCSNMGVGGFQKSLVSLLRCFDYEKYDVDLLLFNPSGIFMDLIPKEVNLLPIVISPEYFCSGKQAVMVMLRQKEYYRAFIRLTSCFLWMFDKSVGASFMVKAVPGLKKHYDVAIDYNGQHVLYYMMSKIDARIKISFFHSDYKKWPYYQRWDRVCYRTIDAIVTVSEECVRSMQEVFPEYADKIYCIENINSEKTVSLFPINSNTFTDEFSGIRLVSVGRVCKAKGFDFAVDALYRLVNENYDVRWYFVGPVEDQEYCDELVETYHLEEYIVFLGTTNNPYDYMRNADIIVHPSRFEGKAVVIEEAKILRKPVIATNFSTVKCQLVNEKTGLIVDMNGQAVYEGIKKLLNDQKLYDHIVEVQTETCFGNESEVEKLYALMEG